MKSRRESIKLDDIFVWQYEIGYNNRLGITKKFTENFH